jgi:glyoxylate reductase
MARPKIFVSHTLFPAPRKLLSERFDADFWEGSDRPPRAEVLRRVASADGMVALLTEKIDAEFLAAAPRLRIVANVAVGYDNIDLAACSGRSVAASNTPGVLDETTADLAWALLMATARRLVEGDTLARSGNWTSWNLDQLCGADVWGSTLGILGMGRIGRAMARRARGFGMRVIYNNTKRAPAEIERELSTEFLDFNEVLAQADFLSLHVPLTPATRHLIGAAELARMKPTAFLINSARGPVVDEAALVNALQKGVIAGAGLDVYEREPVISEGLRRPNVVLLPHMGSASIATRTRMATMAAENVIAFFDGKRPPNILNPAVLENQK